jgi:hypothetical protein
VITHGIARDIDAAQGLSTLRAHIAILESVLYRLFRASESGSDGADQGNIGFPPSADLKLGYQMSDFDH